MNTVDQNTQQTQPQSTLQDDLDETNQKLSQVQRALKFQDSMSDERLEETLKKEARLIKRRTELEQAIKHSELIARQREQAKDDIDCAGCKWSGWDIEKKRSFIRTVTDAITLEEIANGWLRLTIYWSHLMGFISTTTTTLQAVDIAYLWRSSGTLWADEELDIIRVSYPTMPRTELLRLLPSRSWRAIVEKARRLQVNRQNRYERLDIDSDVSVTDVQVLSEFMLEKKRFQWIYTQLPKDDNRSRSLV